MKRCEQCSLPVLSPERVRAELQSVLDVGDLRPDDGGVCTQHATACGRMKGRLDSLLFGLSISSFCKCGDASIVQRDA